ncbi:MAG: hypothetical protein VX767_02310 [Candidatus Neomarinimicrobiota bacterium]|nr:hypothetical protein [Candidatus Neomarinimicrobiota bacterium]
MLEGIICPVCESTLDDEHLRESLVCEFCRTDLKDRKYLDFLEYLMTNGIVKNLDFFDTEVYSEDIERLSPEDEEEGDPADFEKKKDNFNFYENEIIHKAKDDKEPDYEEFDGLNEDWEEFNRREFEGF